MYRVHVAATRVFVITCSPCLLTCGFPSPGTPGPDGGCRESGGCPLRPRRPHTQDMSRYIPTWSGSELTTDVTNNIALYNKRAEGVVADRNSHYRNDCVSALVSMIFHVMYIFTLHESCQPSVSLDCCDEQGNRVYIT